MSVQSKSSWEKRATVDLIKGHTPSFRLRRPDSRCVAMHHVYTVRKALSFSHSRFSPLMERKERTTLPKMSRGSARMRASSPSSRSEAAGDSAEEVPSMRTRAGRGRGEWRGARPRCACSRLVSLSPMDNSRAQRSIKRKEEETWTSAATTAGAPTARRTSRGDSVWARRRWTLLGWTVSFAASHAHFVPYAAKDERGAGG